ncbi:MAG TPA: mycofactocin biosynthesis glycosyltransferase MftF [Microbacteriaceae bacterium]|nr:mycofactocin biosynthesis glycosyltransferase MftF [Microbacteriaceae bacterium]
MTALPTGYTIRLGDDVWQHDRGRTLVGGAPLRVLRLTPRARALLRGGTLTVFDSDTAALAERLLDAGVAHPVLDRLPELPLELLTVVIPTYGRTEQVRRLLQDLPPVATIVVDDASPRSQRVALAVAARQAGARLIRLPMNAGPAAARNAGLAVVATPFVAFVDSDVRLPPSALETLLRHFADPRLALIGPRVRGLPDRHGGWVERYEDARSSLDLGRAPALVRPRSTVSWLSSTCLVARTEALGDGFDATMRVGEDVDLVWRLTASNWHVRYEPAVEVGHAHRTTLGPWLRRKAFYGTGAAPLAQRHPAAIPPAILRPWSVVALLGLVIGRPWSLAVSLAATGVAARGLRRRLPDASPEVVLRLTASGLGSAIGQGAALALRHWWPLSVTACLVSRRARRVIAVAAVVDAAVEYGRLRPRLDPLRFAILRRLDDLAYGAGLWWGALRARRARALLPELAERPAARPTEPPAGRAEA